MSSDQTYTFGGPEGLMAHYTKAATVFDHILPSGKLRMSPYKVMRDPAESQDIVPGYVGDPENADAAWADALDMIKRTRDAMRVLSFTGDAADHGDTFDCCWARPRMWEQYGDLHRGACLVFDRERLIETLRADMHTKGLSYDGDVRYTRQGIAGSDVQMLDSRILDQPGRARVVAQFVQDQHEDFFLLKSDDFATEHEFRAVLMEPSADDAHVSYAHVSYGHALVAVVLGMHFPTWGRDGARAACERAGVEARRMHWEHGQPFALSL